jgi:quercetin dioxygenase-like cupin family protein
MPVIAHADQRRTRTPGGLMTTCASPAQGGTGLAVWRVEVPAGTEGPVHTIDVEQIWTFLDGHATVRIDGADHPVAPGDTAVLPAGAVRRVLAGPDGYRAVVASPAGGLARRPGSDETIAPEWTR